MDNHNRGGRNNFVRNGEGSSSVRLRRRKDVTQSANQATQQQQQQQQQQQSSDQFANVKKRNRHSGDFYQWNHYQQQYHPAVANNIVIPVNRFSMFENRLIIDPDPRMETLDRRIPGENVNPGILPSSVADLWKVPILSRPPISGTGHRILAGISNNNSANPAPAQAENSSNYGNQRRSCDLSGSTGKLLDSTQTGSNLLQNSKSSSKLDSDVKTDVNRNQVNNNNNNVIDGNKHNNKVNSKSAAKKYHKKASKSELQLHRNSHQFLENQSLVMSSHQHHKSESKLLDNSDYNNLIHDTNTEVSLVTGVEYGGGPEVGSDSSATTVLKGVLWQQRDKVFSRWKERYFVLTSDYLQCFKKSSPSVMHSAASEMGRFIFKLKLTEITSADLVDKRGYLTICLHLSKEGSRILLRKPEGIREWHEALKTCITKSRERKGLMKSTKDFWSKKQFDNASQYSDHWLISRTHHARGNYFNKKDKTAMVAQDYGFIDAPPPSKPNNSSAGSNNRQQATVVNNNSGIQTKETIGNHNSSNANHSRAGGNKKSSSIAQLAIPATSPRELLGSEQQQKQMDHHPASGFGTKDSSDSKSHDSGIDSIEKPGRSPVSYSSTSTATKDDTAFNNNDALDKAIFGNQQSAFDIKIPVNQSNNQKQQHRMSSADRLADNFATTVQMQERTPSFRRQPKNNATANRRPKSSYIPPTSSWMDPELNSFGTVIQRPQITKL